MILFFSFTSYQPHDIIRRKIRHGISRDIRKEILFRVREVVKKDLEPEVRKSITREAFWDVLQESKSKNNRENEMARTELPAPNVPPKVPQSNSTDNQNLMSGTTKLPATKRKQSKSKDDQTVMAHTRPPGKGQPKVKDDQNVPSRKPNLPAKRQHSKFSEDLDWILFWERTPWGVRDRRGTSFWWFEVFAGAWIYQFWVRLYYLSHTRQGEPELGCDLSKHTSFPGWEGLSLCSTFLYCTLEAGDSFSSRLILLLLALPHEWFIHSSRDALWQMHHTALPQRDTTKADLFFFQLPRPLENQSVYSHSFPCNYPVLTLNSHP